MHTSVPLELFVEAPSRNFYSNLLIELSQGRLANTWIVYHIAKLGGGGDGGDIQADQCI